MLASHKIPLIAIALLGVLGVDTQASFAQVRRYRPSRPTTSSYLNLTRFNPSPVPNYYSLVRPAQRQRAFNLQEQSLRRQQAGSIQQLRNDVQLGLQPAEGTGKSAGFLQPSTRSTFGGTSNRYFQTKSVRLGR